MVAAGAAWGAYSLLGRGAADPIVSNARAFARAVIPAVLMLLLPAATHAVSSEGVVLAVVSGSLTSGIGYSLWYAALPLLSGTRAAVVQLTVPVLDRASGRRASR